MSAEVEQVEEGRRRRLPRMTRARGILLVLALLILLALCFLWLQRRPIAEDYIDRELTRRGVVARYKVTEIGPWRQRLEDVVIGDPKNPDLVADWVEVGTSWAWSGVGVQAVRAGHVRLRGRLIDGKLRLGELDKLMPAPSGKPFALPELDVDVADARMRLETPQGVVGLKLSGKGRLDDGFAGRVAAVSERLDLGSCMADRAAAVMQVSIEEGRPSLKGPLRASELRCGETRLVGLGSQLDATLEERLDRWQGNARLSLEGLRHSAGDLVRLGGTVSFEGGPQQTVGMLDLAADGFRTPQMSGQGMALAGSYKAGTRGLAFEGTGSASGMRLAPATVTRIAALSRQAAGTPVGPLAAQLFRAASAAGNRFAAETAFSAHSSPAGGEVKLARVALNSASGANLVLAGGDGLAYRWPHAGLSGNGLLTLGGGGLPEAAVRLTQLRADGAVSGSAIVQPYAAGGARLALQKVNFSVDPSGATGFSTRMNLSGPLPGGRIDGLDLPLDGRWGDGSLLVNPRCAPVAFQRLAISGLALAPTRLNLCPAEGAMVAMRNGRLGGGVRTADLRLIGRLGGTPLRLNAGTAEFLLADQRFALGSVSTRLGSPERVTSLDVTRLTGRVAGGGVAGSFSGGAGQIGNVPLLLSNAAGNWRFAQSRLSVDGAVQVADADTNPRFNPLISEDMKLTLAGNDILATGSLLYPADRTKIADVRIAHDLGQGSGAADLTVPGIRFNEKGLQPEALTRLTLGVIAVVNGTVSGEGKIRWSPAGVTSTGTFRTTGTDLAAAFGPVTGLSGEIRFTDLLGLETAPGQVATLAEVNPGIPVANGTLRYQLLPGMRIGIEGGRWPFAGGALILEPTVLDFAKEQVRRMTFRVEGVDAALFLQEMAFDNINATGKFDGVLPMIFDESGGRIEGGHIVARGAGNLAYVGEVTKEDVGFWGNMAFEALKSLNYNNLQLEMNGPLAGEMVTQIRFDGVSQGEGTKSNFLIRRLAKLPFVFNVTIRAPFRQLIDTVQSYYDPSRLIQRNLPALMEEQRRREQEQQVPAAPAVPTPPAAPAQSIQPKESETVP